MKKPYRHRFEVKRVNGLWSFYNARRRLVFCDRAKRIVVAVAADDCGYLWSRWGIRSELTIRRANGTIQDKRTYGDDPRKTKG